MGNDGASLSAWGLPDGSSPLKAGLRLESTAPPEASPLKNRLERGRVFAGSIGALFAQNLFHHACDQLLRVAKALRNDLDVHRWFSGLPGALAIAAVLSHPPHRVCQQVQSDG